MQKINILDSALRCAQGNASQTVALMKGSNPHISSKKVETLDATIEIPYFLFQEEVTDVKVAIKDIVKEISDKLSSKQKKCTALIIGTALVDENLVDAIESTVYEYKKEAYSSSKKSIDTFAKEISEELGLNPFTVTVSTACTSSANALLEARNLINSSVFDYAIVVGVEVSSQMMSNGFSSMKLLSTTTQKPFDVSRDGLILGEAIAAVLIGKEESLWTLLGGYSNCNSLNITSVSPTGEEYVQVMERAISLSKVNKEQIDVIKAHATSTPTNDLSEINAISKMFDSSVRFTAIKPYIGHTLGACGILELALFISCIDDGFIPKTLHHKNSIIEGYKPLEKDESTQGGIFMLNYFGFGGNNTSLIIQKELA